jgi:hypothetical protein
MTPFEAIYGKNPSLVLSYMLGVSTVQEVIKNLTVRRAILHALKDNLVMDHNRMKQPVDQVCYEIQFVEGEHMFL